MTGSSTPVERAIAHTDEQAATRDGLFEVAREVAYAPVVAHSLVALTSKRLLSIISLGLIEVGEQLPREPELAERLGVSLATLREALSGLRVSGVVETRRGRGGGTVVVSEVPPPSTQDARRQLAAMSFDDLGDLGDYHVALAGRAATLAAERATSAEADLLRSLVSAMVAAGGFVAFARLNAQFHIGLASAARSARLAAGETGVQAELAEFASIVGISPAELRVANAEHERILAGVAARDAARARDAAERHAQGLISLLLEVRSELSHVDDYTADGAFVGLRPFGSGLGSMPTDLTEARSESRGRSVSREARAQGRGA